MEIKDIPISSLIANQTGIHENRYNRIKHVNPEDFPPIEVEETNEHDGYFIIDGHTRAYIAKEKGRRTIKANVRNESGLGRVQALMVQDALKTKNLVHLSDLKLY